MRLKIETPWRFVGVIEFEQLIKRYPRQLFAEPPLDRKARFRNYCDASLGEFPSNVVATWNTSRRAGAFHVRIDVEGWEVKGGAASVSHTHRRGARLSLSG